MFCKPMCRHADADQRTPAAFGKQFSTKLGDAQDSQSDTLGSKQIQAKALAFYQSFGFQFCECTIQALRSQPQIVSKIQQWRVELDDLVYAPMANQII
ncbi:MAG: hypothetical protein ABS92_12430 [Thiobacillus sp. SCN 63-374]|nr:MAG: hypothetical protein ABS92_12430 [Thiobacillus sp. SCN 63-374]